MTDLREQPRSWSELLVEFGRAHAAGLWLVMFLGMTVFVFFSTAALLHANVVTIEWIAAAEARTGESLSRQLYDPGAIVSLAVQVAAAAAALHGYITNR